MKKAKRALISLIFASLTVGAEAAYIANRDFLSVGHGARANAMGEAFVAVADDSSAIFWNSAGLTQIKQDEMSFSYSDRFDGLANEAQFNYARRGRKAMWGYGYTGSYVKDITITQSLTAADINAINTGSFGASNYETRSVIDNAFLLSYARPVSPDSPHNVGATAKLIYRDLLGMVRGYGTAFDIGYHYTARSENLRFGVNVMNAASITSFSGNIDNLGVKATATESYLPNIKTGIAYMPTWRVLNGRLMMAIDVNMLSSFTTDDFRAGLEYSFGEIISLRGGKVFGRQDDTSEDYALGMGIRIRHLQLDFSFLSNELGDTTRGTVSYRLGGDYSTPTRY